ncbi:hypothetical protein EBQ74_09090 [bacterium]|nr:hypothetical protein [bacterium]
MTAINTEKTPWRGWLQLLLGLGITVLFFSMMAPFVVAILLGAIIAILCYPMFDRSLKRLPRAISALWVTLAVTLGVLIPFVLTLYSATYRTFNFVSKYRLLKNAESIEQIIESPVARKWIAKIPTFIPIDRIGSMNRLRFHSTHHRKTLWHHRSCDLRHARYLDGLFCSRLKHLFFSS